MTDENRETEMFLIINKILHAYGLMRTATDLSNNASNEIFNLIGVDDDEFVSCEFVSLACKIMHQVENNLIAIKNDTLLHIIDMLELYSERTGGRNFFTDARNKGSQLSLADLIGELQRKVVITSDKKDSNKKGSSQHKAEIQNPKDNVNLYNATNDFNESFAEIGEKDAEENSKEEPKKPRKPRRKTKAKKKDEIGDGEGEGTDSSEEREEGTEE